MAFAQIDKKYVLGIILGLLGYIGEIIAVCIMIKKGFNFLTVGAVIVLAGVIIAGAIIVFRKDKR